MGSGIVHVAVARVLPVAVAVGVHTIVVGGVAAQPGIAVAGYIGPYRGDLCPSRVTVGRTLDVEIRLVR